MEGSPGKLPAPCPPPPDVCHGCGFPATSYHFRSNAGTEVPLNGSLPPLLISLQQITAEVYQKYGDWENVDQRFHIMRKEQAITFLDAGAEKAFELLRQSMLSLKKVAVAKTVMGTNEKLLVLYPTKEGIIVKTLFFHDEIAAVPKPVRKMKLDENELSIAKMLIENMTKPFVAEDYHDEYQERFREAIMKKIEGQEIVSADTGSTANVIDLMDALQKSLELSGKKDKRSREQLTGTA